MISAPVRCWVAARYAMHGPLAVRDVLACIECNNFTLAAIDIRSVHTLSPLSHHHLPLHPLALASRNGTVRQKGRRRRRRRRRHAGVRATHSAVRDTPLGHGRSSSPVFKCYSWPAAMSGDRPSTRALAPASTPRSWPMDAARAFRSGRGAPEASSQLAALFTRIA